MPALLSEVAHTILKSHVLCKLASELAQKLEIYYRLLVDRL